MATNNLSPGDANMILVMGVTGSGKSYLINQLAGYEVVKESAKLHACTQVCQGIPINIGKTKVLLIDTPGFDDTKRTDAEILMEISKTLTAQYKLGVSLKGVIYLHRIMDPRYNGSSIKTLEIFKEICGDAALKNVILATSRWDKVEEHEGAAREKELREEFWSYMLARGSTMARYYGDRDSAHAMLSQLLGSESIVMDIQRQMVDEGKRLDETAAGALINGKLSRIISDSNAEIESLRRELRESNGALRQKMEEDEEKRQAILRQAQKDQVSLHANIASEIQQEIDVEMRTRKKKSSKLGMVLPLFPAALSILGMFLGIPMSSGGLFSSWLFGEDGADGEGGLFSEIFS